MVMHMHSEKVEEGISSTKATLRCPKFMSNMELATSIYRMEPYCR